MVDHFGNVLRSLHKSSGVSQYKIAKDIGMASSNYNAMLNRKDMKCSTFFGVCEAMGYKAEDICQYLR